MRTLTLAAIALAVWAQAAKATPRNPELRAALWAALDAQAGLPTRPPSLPDVREGARRPSAVDPDDRRKDKDKDAVEKSAQSQAGERGSEASDRAHAEAAAHAAQGSAASAARSANSDGRAAVAQERSNAAHGGKATGHGGHGPPPHPPKH